MGSRVVQAAGDLGWLTLDARARTTRAVAESHFADRYIERSRTLGSPLCLGLDPHLGQIPGGFGVDPERPASTRSVEGVRRFCLAVVNCCADRVAVLKPQSAFFEQMGHRGLQVLEEVARAARDRGLLVVLDVKRGDIGSTARAYARSFLYPDSPCRVDAVTLSPYLGLDSLEPFVEASQQHGAGLFVLARTSNAGAKDFQSLSSEGRPLYQRVAEALAPLAERLVGVSGWSSLGVVAGATYPEEAVALREALPRSLFLVPGFGVQGASATDTLSGFVPGPGGHLEGGMVNSSRGILFGPEEEVDAWQQGMLRRLEQARAQLAAASAR